jgi:hypothetical protein
MEDHHEEIRVRAELGALIRQEPFWPFELVMVSGDRYRIDNPGEIVLGEEVVTIIRLQQTRYRYSILRFNQIAAIDVEELG